MTPPRLLVPVEQLRAEIRERVTLGQKLRLDMPGPRDNSDDYWPRYREWINRYRNWIEYNEALLRRSFDMTAPAEEYTERTRYSQAPDSIDENIRWMRSLVERIHLFQLHPDAPTAVRRTANRSVHGEDISLCMDMTERPKRRLRGFCRNWFGV